MQHLELTPEERDMLRENLQRAMMEIDVEIFRTDTHDFKEILKHRRLIMEHLLTKLSPMAEAA